MIPEEHWRAVCACGWVARGSTQEAVARAATRHSDEAGGGPLRVEEVNPSPATATIVSLEFTPVQVFPVEDPMTTPLLRLMLAADDVRLARLHYVETSERLRAAVGVQQNLLTGEHWYEFRLLCSHLHEAIDALVTLMGTVSPADITRLLKGNADGLKAFETLRAVASVDKPTRMQTFLSKARSWIGSHYDNGAIRSVYGKYAASGYINGTVTGSDVGGLTRFIMTDALAILVLLDAAGAQLPKTVSTEADAAAFRLGVETAIKASADEVLPLSEALPTFVDSLAHILVLQRGYREGTRATIEIPPLLRAAAESVILDRKETVTPQKSGPEQAERP